MRQQQGTASARLKLKTLNDNPYLHPISFRLGPDPTGPH